MDIRWRVGLRMRTGKDSIQKVVCETEIEIKNAEGLHMRPAMQFVDVANRFSSDITVTSGENSADGKSIMQMSMLAAAYGTRLKIRAEGVDAQGLVSALQELVEEKMFGEPPPKRLKTQN